MHSFDSAIHKLLTHRVAHARAVKTNDLISGGGVLNRNSADATGIRYAEHVGYFQALKDFEAWCEEVIDDLQKD